VEAYLNRGDVQAALHANDSAHALPWAWSDCNHRIHYNWCARELSSFSEQQSFIIEYSTNLAGLFRSPDWLHTVSTLLWAWQSAAVGSKELRQDAEHMRASMCPGTVVWHWCAARILSGDRMSGMNRVSLLPSWRKLAIITAPCDHSQP